MTRLEWGSFDKPYELGVDRGVLYFPQKDVVPWAGLVRVTEQTTASSGEAQYFDGVIYNVEQNLADFAAQVEAFVFPYMLEDHVFAMHDARTVSATAEETAPFGFSYRTIFGEGHKIHLVYNVLAAMDTISRQTIQDRIDVQPFTFQFQATPVELPGARPTAHIYVDTQEAGDSLVFELEKILYGSATTSPRFPQPEELITLFNE